MEINFGDPLIQIITLILILAILGGVLRLVLKVTLRVISLGCGLIFVVGLILILLQLSGR
ncbi:MAG: hypothetical protein PVF85_08590 [Anaerolineales bacterium]|jgi:hypothetical protein